MSKRTPLGMWAEARRADREQEKVGIPKLRVTLSTAQFTGMLKREFQHLAQRRACTSSGQPVLNAPSACFRLFVLSWPCSYLVRHICADRAGEQKEESYQRCHAAQADHPRLFPRNSAAGLLISRSFALLEIVPHSDDLQGMRARTFRDGPSYRAVNSESNLVPCPAEPTTLIDR
jgi:hypothetical protein